MEPTDNLRPAILSLRNTIRILIALLAIVACALIVPPLMVYWAARKVMPSAASSLGLPTTTSTGRSVTVTRASGGPVQTHLGYGIVVNKESSLEREALAVHDPTMPVDIVGTPSVTTSYKSGDYTGSFQFGSKFKVTATEPISAVEVRFMTFDVWGEHLRNLISADVFDWPGGEKELDGAWPAQEGDATSFYASLAYVARVRTKAGKVIKADEASVLAEAKKFSERFAAAGLEPSKQEKK